MEKTIKRIPIARCPVPDCGRTLMYSGDPKDKHTVTLSIASDGYRGKTMMCPKCKTVLKVIEKPKVRQGISLCRSSAVSNADKLQSKVSYPPGCEFGNQGSSIRANERSMSPPCSDAFFVT